MQNILSIVSQSSDAELNEIAKAVVERYAVLFPDWDVTYVALHKDPARRAEDLKKIISQLDIRR